MGKGQEEILARHKRRQMGGGQRGDKGLHTMYKGVQERNKGKYEDRIRGKWRK